MQNKKIITLVISAIVLVIVLIVFKYMFESVSSEREAGEVTELPGLENVDIERNVVLPYSDPLRIETPQGDVLLDDPRELEETSSVGSGIFSLTTLENSNPVSFGVIFNESNGSFAIGLEQEPIAQARLEAEQYMQDTLKISEEDMCFLNIFVGVPFSVNSFYSGQNLGLSFCPGSVSLE